MQGVSEKYIFFFMEHPIFTSIFEKQGKNDTVFFKVLFP